MGSVKGSFISMLITALMMAVMWQVADMGFSFTFWWKVGISVVILVAAKFLGKIFGG